MTKNISRHIFSDRIKLHLSNFSWLMLGQIVFRALYFIALALLARKSSIEDFGEISYMLLFVGMWLPIFNFGIGPMGIRAVIKENILESKFIEQLLPFKALLSLLAFGLIYITVYFFEINVQNKTFLFLIALHTLFLSIAEFFHIPLFTTDKIKIVGIVVIIERFIVSGLSIIGLYLIGASGFVWGFFIGSILAILISIIVYKKYTLNPESYLKNGKAIDRTWTFSFLMSCTPIALTMFLQLLYARIGITILNSSDEFRSFLPYYNTAFIIVYAFQMFSSTLINSIFPTLNRVKINSVKFWRVIKYSLTALSVICLIVYSLSDMIVPMLFGQKFLNASKILKIFSFSFPFLALNVFFGNYALILGYSKVLVIITTLGVGFNVLFSYLLFKHYHIEGLSLAYVATEFVLFVSFLVLLDNHHFKNQNHMLTK